MPHRVWLLALALSAVAAQALPAPTGSAKTVWEAESATAAGEWQKVSDVQAGGGGYLESRSAGPATTLSFPFEVTEPTTLRVRPIWWRSGNQTSATRYPFPFEANPGPDGLVAAAGRLFFAAPTAARIGVVDPATEKLVRTIEVGGYLADLVADPSGTLVCAADAIGNRVVVYRAADLSLVREIAVPEEPWSLAVGGGKLFVACRHGRAVVSVDAVGGQVSAPRQLPAEPVSIEWQSDANQVLIRYTPQVVNLLTLERIAADEQLYSVGPVRTSVKAAGNVVVDSPRSGVLRVQPQGKPAEEIDVTEVTRDGALPAGSPALAQGRRSPDLVVAVGTTVFFTSPATGALGVYDLKAKQLGPAVELGGCPVDIVPSPAGDKLYVADAATNAVHIVDVRTQTVLGKLDMPATPAALVAVKEVAIQRPENEAPFPVQKLFVLSRGANVVTVVDALTDQVVKTLTFDAPIRRLAEVPVAASGWWGLYPVDRIAARLTPKLAAEVTPDRLTAALQPAPGEGSSVIPRHNTLKVNVNGADKVFAATDYMVLKVDDKRWVDVSAATDPQLAAPPPLGPDDQPGAITLSVDGGAEYDWRRGIWHDPRSLMFLVNESDEFWRWNAQAFRLQPGQHTIRVLARHRLARLDALEVWRESSGQVQMSLHPEPRAVHDQVRIHGYDGVFYDQEPVRFSVELASHTAAAQHGRLTWRLVDYMDEPVADGSREVTLAPGQTVTEPLDFAPQEHGRQHLTLTLETELGAQVQEHHYLRMPKLEHPRMLFRRDQIPAIRARIAAHPVLFQRYVQWLTEKLKNEGDRFPDLWMPKTFSADELAKLAPPGKVTQMWNWRMYELAWRMIGVQFAATYLAPDNQLFEDKLQPLITSTQLSYYCTFHHHGPYFPGAEVDVWDIASDEVRAKMPVGAAFGKALGDMNMLPWTLGGLEEPVTPHTRGMLYKLMTWLNTAERYTSSHVGRRAGTLWQNPWTGCHCQNHGMLLSLLYFRSFFDEPRLYEKRVFQGFFTFLRYVDPLKDNVRLLPAERGPLGEPTRWLQAMVSRHPLERTLYFWDDWYKRSEGDLGAEPKALDDLFELKGEPLTGPLGGGVHHFVSGVHAPLALALGWYDPDAPKVAREELPPTILCDQDGWVPMRSDWGGQATEVNFVCGTRDHTCRTRPGHFTLNQAGEFLIGTPSLFGDDGNNTCSWANSVVVDDDWVKYWRTNLTHPRDGEYFVINRFSGPTWKYLARDRSLVGYNPAEGGWGGGLDLHGHTETCYLREGRIIGYRTAPEFDYVAGDASNGWPLSKVEEYTRQLVFIRPGTLVIYDRIRLGDDGRASRFMLTTGSKAQITGVQFGLAKGAARLSGQVLLPADATLSTPAPYPGYVWKGQQLLQIEPADPQHEQEYLTVLQVGAEPVSAKLAEAAGQVGVELLGGARVMFARSGSVGGTVALPGAAAVTLPQQVEDTYRNWKSDPRYDKWAKEERFRFVVLKGDLDGQ